MCINVKKGNLGHLIYKVVLDGKINKGLVPYGNVFLGVTGDLLGIGKPVWCIVPKKKHGLWDRGGKAKYDEVIYLVNCIYGRLSCKNHYP
jgi:hypothetical protein